MPGFAKQERIVNEEASFGPLNDTSDPDACLILLTCLNVHNPVSCSVTMSEDFMLRIPGFST
jgi:hypothetical protein